MAENKVQIIIEAIQKNFDSVKTELNGLQQGIQGVQTEAKTSSMSILGMAASFGIATTAVMALKEVLNAAIDAFKKGFNAVEDYKVSVASLAAAMATFSEKGKTDMAGAYKEAYVYAGQLVTKLEEMDAKTVATGKELTAMVETLIQGGVQFDVNNKKQEEGLITIANALKLMTQGQNADIQMRQEIRGLLDGQVKATDRLAKILEQEIGGSLKDHVQKWKEEGTLIENVATLLGGFSEATKDLESTWMAVKSTIDTVVNKLLREAFKPLYEDIVGLAKDFTVKVMDGDTAIKGVESSLSNGVYKVWVSIKGAAESVWNIVSAFKEPLTWIVSLIGQSFSGWGQIFAILPSITSRIKSLIEAIIESVKMVGNLGAAFYYLTTLQFDKARESVNAASKNWTESGKKTGAAFASGLGDEIDSALKKYNLKTTNAGDSKATAIKLKKPASGDDEKEDKISAKWRAKERHLLEQHLKEEQKLQDTYDSLEVSRLENQHKTLEISDDAYYTAKKEAIWTAYNNKLEALTKEEEIINNAYAAQIAKTKEGSEERKAIIRERDEAIYKFYVQSEEAKTKATKEQEALVTQEIINQKAIRLAEYKAEYDDKVKNIDNGLSAFKTASQAESDADQNRYSRSEISAEEYYGNELKRIQELEEKEIESITAKHEAYEEYLNKKLENSKGNEKEEKAILSELKSAVITYNNDITKAHTDAANRITSTNRTMAKDIKAIYGEAGILGAAKEGLRQLETEWGNTGQNIVDAVKSMGSAAETALTDTFIDIVKQDWDDLGDVFGTLCDNILKAFMKVVADMVLVWLASGLASLFTDGTWSPSGSTTGSSPGGIVASAAVSKAVSSGLTALGSALGITAPVAVTAAQAAAAGGGSTLTTLAGPGVVSTITPTATVGTAGAGAAGGAVAGGTATGGAATGGAVAGESALSGLGGIGAGTVAAYAAAAVGIIGGIYMGIGGAINAFSKKTEYSLEGAMADLKLTVETGKSSISDFNGMVDGYISTLGSTVTDMSMPIYQTLDNLTTFKDTFGITYADIATAVTTAVGKENESLAKQTELLWLWEDATTWGNNACSESIGVQNNLKEIGDALGNVLENNADNLYLLQDALMESDVKFESTTDLVEILTEQFGLSIEAAESWAEALNNIPDEINTVVTTIYTTEQGAGPEPVYINSETGSTETPKTKEGENEGWVSPHIMHSGGVFGELFSISRLVPASVFAGAQRYHTGLASDEVPGIFQLGEGIVSRKGMQTLGMLNGGNLPSGGGRTIEINSPLINIQGNLIADRRTFEDFVDQVELRLTKLAGWRH